MSVTLNWNPFSDTSVDAYHVFRSITGFVIPFPNSLAPGAQLKFAATSPTLQVVNFTTVDQASVIQQINAQAKGIVASATTAGPAAVLVRCTGTVNPILKLMSCSALTQLGISPGLVGPMQNFVDIGTVPFVDTNQSYSFTDPDGANTDWYYLKTITSLVYSLPTIALQPIVSLPAPCAIEGRVIDLSGNPIVGAEVTATVAVQGGTKNNAGIVTGPITVLTDFLGRWMMTLPLVRHDSIRYPCDGIQSGYSSS